MSSQHTGGAGDELWSNRPKTRVLSSFSEEESSDSERSEETDDELNERFQSVIAGPGDVIGKSQQLYMLVNLHKNHPKGVRAARNSTNFKKLSSPAVPARKSRVKSNNKAEEQEEPWNLDKLLSKSPTTRSRAKSASWRNTAKEFRKSARLLPMMQSKSVVEEISGKVVVRRDIGAQRERQKRQQHDFAKQKPLSKQVQGISARLPKDMELKLISMGPKGFWSLKDIISIKTEALTPFLKLHVGKKLCVLIGQMQWSDLSHGNISAKTVLMDRNLNVSLMKPRVMKIAKKFRKRRIRNDIFFLGVVLLELFSGEMVAIDYCPGVFRLVQVESDLGQRRKTKSELYEIEQKAFRDIKDVLGKKSEEISDVDALISLIKECIQVDAENRPPAEKLVEQLEKQLLDVEGDEDDHKLSVLETILTGKEVPVVKEHRLFVTNGLTMARSRKGMNRAHSQPPVKEMKRITERRLQPVKLENANRTPGGYVTDDSFYVSGSDAPSDADTDADSVFSNLKKDSETKHEEEMETPQSNDAEDNLVKAFESNLSRKESPPPLPAKSKKRKGSKKKGAFSALKAFLSSTSDPLPPMPELETQSVKIRPVDQQNPKRKTRLSQFSQFSQFETNEEPVQVEDKALSEADHAAEVRRWKVNELRASAAFKKSDLDEFNRQWKVKKAARRIVKQVDPNSVAQGFLNQEFLPVDVAYGLLKRAIMVLKKEPNMLRLEAPMTVVGDIHGQFFDLQNMIQLCGPPSAGDSEGDERAQQYLFLGDYVDRGNFSCEVLLYLVALKLKHPDKVWLLRGNHETKATSAYFGFKEECTSKYGKKFFSKACALFRAMPICALLSTPSGNFFCLHGGISPNVTDLNQFLEFDRFQEPTMNGFLCDVLWADPVTVDDEEEAIDGIAGEEEVEKEKNEEQGFEKQMLGEYFSNPLRGCSYRFGLQALKKFLDDNNLLSIIRAHQVQSEGYCFHYQELSFKYFGLRSQGGVPVRAFEEVCPPIVTVFSAPNYCGRYGNKAAVLNIEATKNAFSLPIEMLSPMQFDAVPEPPAVTFQSDQSKVEMQFSKITPYMPSLFDDFIEKALSLGNTDLRQVLNATKQEIEARRESLLKLQSMAKKDESVVMRQETEKEKKSAEEPFEYTFAARDVYLKNIQKGFKAAEKADRVNEINPLRVQEMTTKAERKLKADKRDKKIGHLPGVSQNLVAADKVYENIDKLVTSKEVSFAHSELVALQALFLIIDRDERGKIGAQDLITWTEDEGGFITPEAAQRCIDIVDFDQDGKIGFEDYLVFAAALKKLYLSKKYMEIAETLKV